MNNPDDYDIYLNEAMQEQEAQGYDALQDYVMKLEKTGHINKDGYPLKCIFCDSNNLIIVNEQFGPMGLEEKEVKCTDCNKITGRWCYGNWQVD